MRQGEAWLDRYVASWRRRGPAAVTPATFCGVQGFYPCQTGDSPMNTHARDDLEKRREAIRQEISTLD
ncbi:hypothetical protein, partial [Brevundimonas sp.]|uniref:hypothetical protein n=1 Tax=Brevundimonas sp. TaxID=1871086 RepID=UPI0025C452F8